MILLTRLSGSAFVLNADLIERLDSTPDSVVTLVDGKKYVVAESLTQIVDLVRTWRGAILATSTLLGEDHQLVASNRVPHLSSVPSPTDGREGEV
jgi:flagellar protein FlbD